MALSEWLVNNTAPSQSVAYIEIGYLGYYTGNRIIDLTGLTVPEIVPRVAAVDFSWGFWRYKPDYYVHLPDFDWALGTIRTHPTFESHYRPVATLSGPKDSDFTIYSRYRD